MKLLVQSDDYGITKAQAYGCIEGIRNGIIRNTGFFPNMPWAAEVLEWIRPFLDRIAFGLDLNASTGPSVLSHKEIPSLVHENGMFLTSRENRALDTAECNYDHVNYDELYKEFEAQILKFRKMVGRMPDYLHPHAYGTATTDRVSRDLAHKYNLPFSTELEEKYGNGIWQNTMVEMKWYRKPATLDNQNASRLKDYILQEGDSWLDREVVFLICHAGYVDRELLDLSSFNIYRLNDLEAMMSLEVMDWIRTRNIELITYKDLAE